MGLEGIDAAYHEASAKLACECTIGFFKEHLA
jgi:hypothetical protein